MNPRATDTVLPARSPAGLVDRSGSELPETAVDPVCGMRVKTETARWKHEHGGQTHYFCNPKCLEKFKADPARYGTSPPQTAEATLVEKASTVKVSVSMGARGSGVAPAALYTCPMHPEVRNEGPGSCPDCGMGLEGSGRISLNLAGSSQN